MPDILIRGMEMPQNCATCDLFGEYGCAFIGAVGYALTQGRRNEDCPLHELPQHGDLVDATQYRDEFMDGVYNMCADDSDNNRANAIIDLYDCAPVVVPAERSGE